MPAAAQTGTRVAKPEELLLTFDFRRPVTPAPLPERPAATLAEAIARWLNEQL